MRPSRTPAAVPWHCRLCHVFLSPTQCLHDVVFHTNDVSVATTLQRCTSRHERRGQTRWHRPDHLAALATHPHAQGHTQKTHTPSMTTTTASVRSLGSSTPAGARRRLGGPQPFTHTVPLPMAWATHYTIHAHHLTHTDYTTPRHTPPTCTRYSASHHTQHRTFNVPHDTRRVSAARNAGLVGRIFRRVHLCLVVPSEEARVALHRHRPCVLQIGVLQRSSPHVPLVQVPDMPIGRAHT